MRIIHTFHLCYGEVVLFHSPHNVLAIQWNLADQKSLGPEGVQISEMLKSIWF